MVDIIEIYKPGNISIETVMKNPERFLKNP